MTEVQRLTMNLLEQICTDESNADAVVAAGLVSVSVLHNFYSCFSFLMMMMFSDTMPTTA